MVDFESLLVCLHLEVLEHIEELVGEVNFLVGLLLYNVGMLYGTDISGNSKRSSFHNIQDEINFQSTSSLNNKINTQY